MSRFQTAPADPALGRFPLRRSGYSMEGNMKSRIRLAVLAVAGLVAVSAIGLQANILLQFSPALGGGVPAYARIERVDGHVLVHNDGRWAAISFFRQPSCVPAGFNLLDFFDAPRAFECELTMEGFEIWRNGPWADVSPIQTVSFGLGAVPIWFVRVDELEGALADDVLTVAELEACATVRKGLATYFKETLHPSGGAQQTKTEVVARGTLPSGESFLFQAEETHNELKHVLIRFK
jgi:hypothetical protein